MSAASSDALRNPRWVLSFADLCLLLLGFFVILHARQGDAGAVAQGMRAAFGTTSGPVRTDYRADAIFQPGEAVLKPSAAIWLARLGAQAKAAKAGVTIVSDGIDPASARLDGWELAAARAAAAGRAVRAGGLDEGRLTLSIPAMGGPGHASGQTLRITLNASTR